MKEIIREWLIREKQNKKEMKMEQKQIEQADQNQKLISETRALVHVSIKTGEVNLLFALRVNLPGKIQDYSFIDSEYYFVEGKQIPLRRKVYLYHLPTKAIYYYQKNRWQEKKMVRGLEFTPHAKAFLDQVHLLE